MGVKNKLLDLALDMSHKARMARAKEQGFDTDRVYYHGTNRQFDEFDPNATGAYSSSDTRGTVSLTPWKEIANRYAVGDAKRIGDKYHLSEWDDDLEEYVREQVYPTVHELFVRGDIKRIDATGRGADAAWQRQQQELAKADGFAGVQFDGIADDTFYNPMGGSADTLQVFDPSNIRSVNAAFDPAKKDSRNLLASLAGGGVLAGSMLPSEDVSAAELVHSTGPDRGQIANQLMALAQQEQVKQNPGLLSTLANTALEGMAAVNRGVSESGDFFTTDQVNALLQLLGRDARVPRITDQLEPATTGNYMRDGIPKDVVRTAGEFLSPL